MMGSASFRKAFNISSKLLILLALIIVTLWKTDAASLASHLDLRILGYIILLQPLAFMCAVFLGKRYSVLLRSDEVRFGTAFKAVILSNGLNVVLPARLSELLKATYVNEKTGHSISKALSAVVLERIGDIIILLLLALACVGSVLFRVDLLYVSVVGAVVVGSLGLLVSTEKTILGLASRVRFPTLSKFLHQFVSHAAGSLKGRSFYVGQMYGVIAWTFSFVLITLFVFLAGSIKIGLSQSLLLFTATTVGLLIPLLPGGIGTYEAAAIYVLKGFGYSFEEALALSLAMHLSQLLLFFVLSLIIVSREHIGIMRLIKRIRSMSGSRVDPQAQEQS
jgi:uncharacterized protein (TIRG00374 family)